MHSVGVISRNWYTLKNGIFLWNLSIKFNITGSKNLLNSSPNVFENALGPHVNNWHVYMPVVYMLSEWVLKNVRRTVKKILRTSDAEPDAQIWQKIHHFSKFSTVFPNIYLSW